MKTEFLALLQALDRHRVDFVVVGGVSAILQGAPIHTVDLDVVYDTLEDNLPRLLDALLELGARYRDPAGRVIVPTLERLGKNRMNLLETDAGVLDVLREIAPGWSYDEVVARSHSLELSGIRLRVLGIASLIESKEAVDRPKDRAVIHVLRHTLEMRRGRGLEP